MKITQISHRNIKIQSFKSGTANKQISNMPAKQPNNQNKGCMPNSVYWALVGYALATSTPAINFVEKITGIDEETKQMNLLLQKQQENFERCLDLTDEFTKVKGLSAAHHPLRQFAETDMAEFFDIDEKTKGMAFSTDDNIIGLEINPDKNPMFGKLIIRNKKEKK